MVGSSVIGQHSLSNHVDRQLNIYLNDKFTYNFHEFLNSKAFNRQVRIQDFLTLFPFSKIDSDLRIKSTYRSGSKGPESIYLHEYLPIDKEDVTGGRGIDKDQNGVEYFDYADIQH